LWNRKDVIQCIYFKSFFDAHWRAHNGPELRDGFRCRRTSLAATLIQLGAHTLPNLSEDHFLHCCCWFWQRFHVFSWNHTQHGHAHLCPFLRGEISRSKEVRLSFSLEVKEALWGIKRRISSINFEVLIFHENGHLVTSVDFFSFLGAVPRDSWPFSCSPFKAM
jgi:hypothetical protein